MDILIFRFAQVHLVRIALVVFNLVVHISENENSFWFDNAKNVFCVLLNIPIHPYVITTCDKLLLVCETDIVTRNE